MQLIKLTEILGDCNADPQITSPIMINPDAIMAVSINETGDTMVHMGPTLATNFIVTESFTEVQEIVQHTRLRA